MEWLTNFLSSLTKLLTPVFAMIIFLMRRREVRAIKRARINQRHRDGIHLVIWYNPQEFESHCQQSLALLLETANLAEGFDTQVWEDIKDTRNRVRELLQIFGFLNNKDLSPQDRNNYSKKQATINAVLMIKFKKLVC